MLGERSAVDAVVEGLARAKPAYLVVDPVMVATSGDLLIAPDAVELVRTALLPLADIVTPNLAEAARLLGEPLAASESDQEAQAPPPRAGPEGRASQGRTRRGARTATFSPWPGLRPASRSARLETKNTHGTGCTLSAAIAPFYARGGRARSGGGGEGLRLAGDRRRPHLEIGHGNRAQWTTFMPLSPRNSRVLPKLHRKL